MVKQCRIFQKKEKEVHQKQKIKGRKKRKTERDFWHNIKNEGKSSQNAKKKIDFSVCFIAISRNVSKK